MVIHFSTTVNLLSYKWTFSIARAIILGLALSQLIGAYFLTSKNATAVRIACYTMVILVGMRPWLFAQQAGLLHLVRSITVTGSLFLLAALCDPHKRALAKESGNRSLILDTVQLVGRVLMTLLFFCEAIVSEYGGLHGLLTAPSPLKFVGFLLLVGSSVLVCIGFKTEVSAIVLSTLLGAFAIWMYPFWWCSPQERGTFVFLFFQTISIMGGLFILASNGPGNLSVEAAVRKKD